VCECLLQVFSLVGIPSVITSDNATYFSSQLNDKFTELFGCKPRFSTVLHPEGNSLVERLNQSLKRMLTHASQKYPKQWHKLLPIVLWCIRESRNETLGVSPFMMLMGWNCISPWEETTRDTDKWSSRSKENVRSCSESTLWAMYSCRRSKYCRSCDICQRTSPKGRVSKLPLGHMSLMGMPFKRVAVDLIGPIASVADRGNR